MSIYLVAIATMNQNQTAQMAELGDGEVRGERSLPTFLNVSKSAWRTMITARQRCSAADLADNSDARVCRLDHADVIAAIADRGDALRAPVLAQKLRQLRLLLRRTATA